jgi:exodeoxyribonuclease VII large subunit
MREMESKTVMTLSELMSEIKGSLERDFKERFWVKGEVGQISVNGSGHCYLDLIDKDEKSGIISTKVRAVIWSSSYRVIKPYFETSTGKSISKGINILVKIEVQFSLLYGLSLIITDIDPSYTIGDQELKRIQTIKKLKEEGMFDLNNQLAVSSLPRNIALISSVSAAGYRDFMTHITNNEYGFVFNIDLYASVMQGDAAVNSIISSLEQISQSNKKYDLVFIVRGGGAAQDLICFDDYNLAVNIAQFPLPIVIGVGHDHDFHIADMVCHTSVKTPTAAADLLIDFFAREEQMILFLSRRLSLSLQGRVSKEDAMVDRLLTKVKSLVESRFTQVFHKIELLKSRVESSDPLVLMSKGYALVQKDGSRQKSVVGLNEGEEIDLLMRDGLVNCIINKIEEM